MRLVFLGAPGSGKGTQAALLVQRLDVGYVSTGDVFRRAIADQTALGKQAKQYLDEGLLVPDGIVLGMIDEVLNGLLTPKGFILDGFPRTLPQAEQLEVILENKKQPLDAVISLEVPEEELLRRLLARHRADDTEETIRIRLATFRVQTEPLRIYYQNKALLKSVEASGHAQEVHAKILRFLDELRVPMSKCV